MKAKQLDWYQLDILITFLVENEKKFLKHIQSFDWEPEAFYLELHSVLESQFVEKLKP